MLTSENPINTFSHYCRETFGAPAGKIPLDLGLRCPNREQGGCIFCRPASFTPAYLSPADALSDQIRQGKRSLLRNRFSHYFAYFQQETCTALPADELCAIATVLLDDPSCRGLIISTRPDFIEDSLLTAFNRLITEKNKGCHFELGMQSSHNRSLSLLNRNHSFGDVTDAINRIKAAGPFSTGVHLLFGIPGETEEEMLESVKAAVQLGVDAVKLHHLQVIRDTALEQLYKRSEVIPFTIEAYLDLLVEVIALLPPHIVVHRLWATAHPDLLIAPRWNILAAELRNRLNERLNTSGIVQGQRHQSRDDMRDKRLKGSVRSP